MTTRDLVFPLTGAENREYTDNATDDISTFSWPTTDNDERVFVTIELSLNEYVQIASALDTGRDISYPDESFYVWYLWQRIIMAAICDQIAECIATSEVVKQALSQFMSDTDRSGSTPNPNAPLSSSLTGQNLIPNDALCTESNKYAMARAIVQELDRLTNDFLEIIEVLTNPNEIAAKLVGGIPVFGDSAALALETADWILDNVKETYAAAYNPTTELDYSCAVYCKFSDCELSFDDIVSAYSEQGAISPPSDTSFPSIVQWLVGVALSTDNQVVGSMHWFILQCMRFGSDFFGSGVFTTLQIEIENAKDEEISVPAECECVETVVWEVVTGTDNGGGSYSSEPFTNPSNPYDHRLVLCVNTTIEGANGEPNSPVTFNSLSGGGASVLTRVGVEGCDTYTSQDYVVNTTTFPTGMTYCGRTIIIVGYAPFTVNLTLPLTVC